MESFGVRFVGTVGAAVTKQAVVALCVIAMVTVVVAVDLAFFRDHAWPRLAANVGIVLVFGAFYVRFLKRW